VSVQNSNYLFRVLLSEFFRDPVRDRPGRWDLGTGRGVSKADQLQRIRKTQRGVEWGPEIASMGLGLHAILSPPTF